MTETVSFSKRLRKWRGKRYLKEAASALDVPTWTYINWEIRGTVPSKLAMAEILRRLNGN